MAGLWFIFSTFRWLPVYVGIPFAFAEFMAMQYVSKRYIQDN